jgi:hypothetical protein
MTPEELWEQMIEMDGDAIELIVERDTIQSGRTFSPEAMQALYDQFLAWVGTRLMLRWSATDEPPTLLVVEVKVTVS